MSIQRNFYFRPIRLNPGTLRAALDRIHSEIVDTRYWVFRAERTDQLTDGSGETSHGTNYWLYENVCALGGAAGHYLHFSAIELPGGQIGLGVTMCDAMGTLNVMVTAEDGVHVSLFVKRLVEALDLETVPDPYKDGPLAEPPPAPPVPAHTSSAAVSKSRSPRSSKAPASKPEEIELHKMKWVVRGNVIVAIITTLGVIGAAIITALVHSQGP